MLSTHCTSPSFPFDAGISSRGRSEWLREQCIFLHGNTMQGQLLFLPIPLLSLTFISSLLFVSLSCETTDQGHILMNRYMEWQFKYNIQPSFIEDKYFSFLRLLQIKTQSANLN